MKNDVSHWDLRESQQYPSSSVMGQWRSFEADIKDKPWAISHVGMFVCWQEVLRRTQPGQALEYNDLISEFWGRMPGGMRDRYLAEEDPIPFLLLAEMAVKDLKRLSIENTSPEIYSEIEDLKLLAADVFGNLSSLGLLPHFNEDYTLEEITYIKYNIYSDFNPAAYSERGFKNAAFCRPYEEVGLVGTENISPITFLHETTHAGIEFHGDRNEGIECLGDVCNSLREAVVQHVADRGYQFARSEYFINPESPKRISSISRRGKIYGFNYAGFMLEDEEGVYEEDRRIMYELCSLDGICITDFVNALMDQSGESLKVLSSKLYAAIGHTLGTKDNPCEVLKFIDNRIDGEMAVAMSGGLTERHERARHVLDLIKEAVSLHDHNKKYPSVNQKISKLCELGRLAFCTLPPVVL